MTMMHMPNLDAACKAASRPKMRSMDPMYKFANASCTSMEAVDIRIVDCIVIIYLIATTHGINPRAKHHDLWVQWAFTMLGAGKPALGQNVETPSCNSDAAGMGGRQCR